MTSRLLRPDRAFAFNRPLVALQSDDWGRVGVRDGEGWERLRKGGIDLGARAYDFYSLETSDDLDALHQMLNKHRDSTGRAACLVMNFVTANLDFGKNTNTQIPVPLKPLSQGLPGSWVRPGLFEALRAGIEDRVFYPALHGLTHFCRASVLSALQNESRSILLHTLWAAETPYIYWRMPWVGYEYCTGDNHFLGSQEQSKAIQEAVRNFFGLFGAQPVSACAPGYRANHDTHSAWAISGIKVAQSGTGHPLLPHLGRYGVLHVYRVLDFEPSQGAIELGQCMDTAAGCFKRGAPLIISIHSLNFHSTLKDFRSLSLKALDTFLSALERRYPDLLYVHDGDLYEIATTGRYRTANGTFALAASYAAKSAHQPAGVY